LLKIYLLFSTLSIAVYAQNMPMTPFKQSIQLGGDLEIDKMRMQNLNIVKKAVEGINKTLPQRVDRLTQLTHLDSNGTRLIYTFEVDTKDRDINKLREDAKKNIAPRIKRGICKDSTRFLQAGIDIRYRYISQKSKRELLVVDVDEKSCKR